jgi:hypothetical protein
VKAAKAARAPAIEAYPVEGDLRAGFRTVGRHTPPRPIMRRNL